MQWLVKFNSTSPGKLPSSSHRSWQLTTIWYLLVQAELLVCVRSEDWRLLAFGFELISESVNLSYLKALASILIPFTTLLSGRTVLSKLSF